MKKVLLVSHGLMAKGTYEAAEMIIGNVSSLEYVCLSKDKDIEIFKNEIIEKIEILKDASQIIVIADILGGSPYITTLGLLQEFHLMNKTLISTGLNLPLTISVALSPYDYTIDTFKQLLMEVREGITLFEVNQGIDEEEEL